MSLSSLFGEEDEFTSPEESFKYRILEEYGEPKHPEVIYLTRGPNNTLSVNHANMKFTDFEQPNPHPEYSVSRAGYKPFDNSVVRFYHTRPPDESPDPEIGYYQTNVPSSRYQFNIKV
jgi:hypothetical protein